MADEQKRATAADYEKRKVAVRESNVETEVKMAVPPTPSQEENDLIKLGLMHPDEKTSHEVPEPKRGAEPPAARTVPRTEARGA